MNIIDFSAQKNKTRISGHICDRKQETSCAAFVFNPIKNYSTVTTV